MERSRQARGNHHQHVEDAPRQPQCAPRLGWPSCCAVSPQENVKRRSIPTEQLWRGLARRSEAQNGKCVCEERLSGPRKRGGERQKRTCRRRRGSDKYNIADGFTCATQKRSSTNSCDLVMFLSAYVALSPSRQSPAQSPVERGLVT